MMQGEDHSVNPCEQWLETLTYIYYILNFRGVICYVVYRRT